MKANKATLCELFQRCGRAELRFIVDMGLWGGFVLGLAQMGLWLLWVRFCAGGGIAFAFVGAGVCGMEYGALGLGSGV